MKRTKQTKKKLVLSRESLVHLGGAALIVVADTGSLSCAGPDCPVMSELAGCSDPCATGRCPLSTRCH